MLKYGNYQNFLIVTKVRLCLLQTHYLTVSYIKLGVLFQIIFLCSLPAWLGIVSAEKTKVIKINMPNVTTTVSQSYVCHMEPIPEDGFVVKLETNIAVEQAHHMLLFGGDQPAVNDSNVWNCGDRIDDEEVPRGMFSGGFSMLVYGTGKEALNLTLPEGIGLKVGGDSLIDYLVIQVHYRDIVMEPDESGVTLYYTTEKQKVAGSILLVASVDVEPGQVEHSEGACEYTLDTPLHPFSYRVHTHHYGTMVSAYLIQGGEPKLIGKANPQEPQMFFPVADRDLVINKGDVLAWRCTYNNTADHRIVDGNMNEDEMCNFYVMIWADSDTLPLFPGCQSVASRGPWYWKDFRDSKGQTLPPSLDGVE